MNRINEIYVSAGLTAQESEEMQIFIDGEMDFFGSTAYEKLYEYFTTTLGEMPYGVAKARTGEPDLWILEQLDYAQS